MVNTSRNLGFLSIIRSILEFGKNGVLVVSGTYLYVNMSTSIGTKLGASAILESSYINPPPKYHSNITSAYYQSCFVSTFAICLHY